MRLVTRGEWGAVHAKGSLDAGPERHVVIHHSYRPALTPTASSAAERAAVRAIERYHVESNGWAGIGYNFLVAPSGTIYEGRGWKYRGAHAGPINFDSIGVCLLIDGSVTSPNDATISAVRQLITEGIALGEISGSYTISGHRDHMNRTCPGDKVYARLSDFRHDAEIPPAEVEIATLPTPRPEDDDVLWLDRIERPTPEHIDAIARFRRLSPDVVEDGAEVVEVLLRGVLAGQSVKEAGLKAAADALADWLKRRSA